ncbi:MAG TPA: hypothetical protein VHD83_07105 [Puia sp.]|nr:hypothetical protein [Puia sp.]
MIKYPVTIVLVLLMAVQTFSKWCLILEYQVNKDFIAKNLCINRAKPNSCCQGKCYLTKKMAADESDQQTPTRSGQREETTLQLFEQLNTLPQPVMMEITLVHSTRYIAPSTQDYSLSQFEPPQI